MIDREGRDAMREMEAWQLLNAAEEGGFAADGGTKEEALC